MKAIENLTGYFKSRADKAEREHIRTLERQRIEDFDLTNIQGFTFITFRGVPVYRVTLGTSIEDVTKMLGDMRAASCLSIRLYHNFNETPDTL